MRDNAKYAPVPGLVANAPQAKRGFSDRAVASHDLQTVIETTRRYRASGLAPTTLELAATAIAGDGNHNAEARRLYAATVYGLVTQKYDSVRKRLEVKILPLGEEVLDPALARSARVKAFLSVELNRALFRRYRGQILPSRPELERVIGEDLGISRGRITEARQLFIRSAKQAEIMAHAEDRLSIPEDVRSAIADFLISYRLADSLPDAQLSASESVVATPEPPLAPGSPMSHTTRTHRESATKMWLRLWLRSGEQWSKGRQLRWYKILGDIMRFERSS